MSKKNILPFALGALAGASLLAVAALCCGQDDNKDKKSLNPASLVKELNQFFFSITGMQIKLQSILSKISKAELEDLNLSLSDKYSRNPDCYENYFYYNDHIQEVNDVQEMTVEIYKNYISSIKTANKYLKEKNIEPVLFKVIENKLIANSKHYSDNNAEEICRGADELSNLLEDLAGRIDTLIERLETA